MILIKTRKLFNKQHKFKFIAQSITLKIHFIAFVLLNKYFLLWFNALNVVSIIIRNAYKKEQEMLIEILLFVNLVRSGFKKGKKLENL
jgi:hypothetical protein